VITSNNWGWCQPNWSGGSVHININNNNIWVNRPAYATQYKGGGNWSHNVEHRRGVAYRDAVTGDKYRPSNNAGVQTRQSYRGRDDTARPITGSPGNAARPATGQAGNMARPSTGSAGNVERPTAGSASNAARPATGQAGNMARPSTGSAGNVERPTAGSAGNVTMPSSGAATSRPSAPGTRPTPAYQPESRPQVQRDAQRGAQSRAAMQRPAPSGNRGGAPSGQGRGR
jgi:hypothetical protein